MSAPNRNTLWGRTVADELANAGVDAVCLAPGSRSTPLTVAIAEHAALETYSILDERSAAFFALGRGRRTGTPTAIVTTSGTAAANLHPAVIEAHQSRVPLLVLTADRPAELRDSGANQTIDQTKLYGDAVRWFRELPEPEPEARKLRSLRTSVCRAVGAATGVPAGPVHLNAPFRKPLEPVEVTDDVPADFGATAELAVEGRDGPFVDRTQGRPALDDDAADRIAETVQAADRGLVVAGPDHPPRSSAAAAVALAAATGFPILADPLSGARFGSHVDRDDVLVCGGYDSYLAAAADWPDPDLVVRTGASPTSKVLRHYLRDRADRQVLVDPAGGWREATFTATDLVAADPSSVVDAVTSALDDDGSGTAATWRDRFASAERRYWDVIDEAREGERFEGSALATAVESAPDPATLFVSNSMPVRDLDRFGEPRSAAITALGNRGASGIDGITSTALGAGSATADSLVLVTGDLAYLHDANGLQAIERCGVDATIVVINNDGGGIFHTLPIEQFDPPFTSQFKTPHGLDLAATGDLYDVAVERVEPGEPFREAYCESLASDGAQVLEVRYDAESSHRTRERIHERVGETL